MKLIEDMFNEEGIAVVWNDARYATLDNITTTAFDLISSADDLTGRDIGFVAINLGVNGASWTGVLTAPTATGNHVFTGVGFKPTFGMLYTTMLTDLNTEEADAKAGAHGLSGFSKDTEFSRSWASEDAADPSNSQTLADNKAVNMPLDDGLTGFEGRFAKFTSDGVIITFSAVDSTARLWPSLFLKI